jgi:aminoglycoside phosphotransferase (APT) family kinase protein
MTARPGDVTVEDDEFRRQFDAVLAAVCRQVSIPVRGAELLRLNSNAVFALPSAGLVVRISTNLAAPDRITASLKVTAWLAEHGFPCTAPAPVTGQPFTIYGKVASVWQYVPETAGPPASAGDLARLLRDLHSRPLPPSPPGTLTDPLANVATALKSAPPGAMPSQDRDWLSGRIGELRGKWAELRFPHSVALIHGDAHPGNLIRAPGGTVVLGDWDHVAIGPPEWDLAQVHYTSRRLGYPAREDVEGFGGAYGWDIRDWPGIETLVAIREVSGLSPYVRNTPAQPFARRELALRISTLPAGDHFARWNRPGSATPPETGHTPGSSD